MAAENNNSKLNYITLLSCVCCLSVIFLHINGCFWGGPNNSWWISSNIIECLFNFAVPCFFMISGITLIDYRDRYDTKTYFKKRILKTLIPYLFWSTIILIIYILTEKIATSTITFRYIFEFYFYGKAQNYGFFIFLFSLYLAIPVLSLIPNKHKIHIIKYIALILFLINSFIPFILAIFSSQINWPFKYDYLFGPLMYACIGYVLNNNTFKTNFSKLIIYTLGLIGLLSHIIGTYFLSINSGTINLLFKGYYNIPCILYSISVLCLFKNISKKHFISFFNYICLKFSKYTFSIYLLHTEILNFYYLYLYQNVFHISDYNIIYRSTVFFFVFPTTLIFIFVLRKIPLAKYVLP